MILKFSAEKMWDLMRSVVLLVLMHSIKESTAQNMTYVVVLPGQDIQEGTENTQIKYELVMTTSSASAVDVDILGVDGKIGSTLSVTEKEVHTFDQIQGMNGSEYANKSIIVHSSNGLFNLQVFVKREDHNYVEGYLGIPIESLKGPHQPNNQTVYSYVAATFCDIGGYCQISVAALNDETPVSIIIPNNVTEIVLCKAKSYIRTKRDTTITLNKFDAIQLESTDDLTGTVIYSFMPIVVFAGSRNVTNGDVVAHTVEQLVPTSHWGTEYAVTNLGTNGYGDILKIVSHWSDTKVTMKGYPSFIMADRYHTTVRRLDKGLTSYITASHPIQIVQITGLTYATVNETSTLSMTVVPSVHNAYTDKILVACQGENAVDGSFFITSGKLSSATTINLNSITNEIKIKYSDYLIGIADASETKFEIENAGGASGIMKCGGQATMPTYVAYNQNVNNAQTFSPTYNGGTCYEGGKAATLFDSSSSTTAPHKLSLQEYPDHVLQLRVKVCGEAVIQFIVNEGSLENSLFLTVTHTQITVTKCIPDCGTGVTTVITDVDKFNSEESSQWDCETDMAFFWFHQSTDSSTDYICFGFGRYDSSKCTGAETDTYFQVNNKFTMVKLMGVASDANFHWDFIDTAGCDVYESDWRCMDRWANCSDYGSSICTDSSLNDFVLYNCAKFCGKCFADSYGRKFYLKLPIFVSGISCSIVVSPLNKNTNIALTLKNTKVSPYTEHVKHGFRNDQGDVYYDCNEDNLFIYVYRIYSDDDVSVITIIKHDDEILSSRIYPVDTFGTEYMPLVNDKDKEKRCEFTSEYDDVKVKSYFSIFLSSANGNPKDSTIVDMSSTIIATQNNNDLTGTTILFDKPSAVYCADNPPVGRNIDIHLLPTNTWSTEYAVPAFDVDTINRPFDGRLLIVSNSDNTIVNISGGFDAIHAIYNRGDKLEQEIDVGAAYHIKASENIAVALYLYDPTDETKSSFTMIPPVQNVHDTLVTSVPNRIMSSLYGFDVTEIKTYSVNGNLNSNTSVKDVDDNDQFYRHVSLGNARFEITVVKAGTDKWFTVPGNRKATVLETDKAICTISIQTVGDDIDNDCDGLNNEDVCFSSYGVYREDGDFDGGFGEDCSSMATEPVVVTAPVEPLCIEINKPKDQCWVACTCRCSWVQKYEAQKNLTHDELVDAQQEEIQQIQTELTVDPEELQTTSAQKESASDERQSAANIGYVGIGLFALVFGTIFIMDISSLVRDACILFSNLREGFERLSECVKGKLC